MLEIFICEDDVMQRKKLTDFVANYIMIEELDMKIAVSTANPYEVIDYLKSHDTTGLYFLDVDLGAKITGIELAKEIRKHDMRCALVFITTHSELMPLTFRYRVEAMDYIVKDEIDLMKQRVVECIQLANERLLNKENKKIFQIKNESKIISEQYANIMFFETSIKKHKVMLHAKNRQVEFYGKLNDIADLDPCLFRCHRSYIVNKDNIAEIDTKEGEIKMKNGEVCYVSTRLMKKLLKELSL